MNEIVMIPIDQLYHHPENPRLDLGDLTELTESIRANGIMQNLTVIPGHRMSKKEWTEAARAEGADKASAEASYSPENVEVSDGYTVVIGNRRMEASKAAGLTELPCVISDMDHKTQITTMLQENMQRADLTVYEQAQGFQMMIDLGIGPKEISEKTGFSETTVRRRLKMAELDPKQLKIACETKGEDRQITLFDFERLAQVDSIKERNALLKNIGDRNFDWSLNRTLRTQRAKAVRKDALKELKDAGIIQLKDSEEYSSKYDRLYSDNVDLGEWKPGKKLIPKSKEQLYFFISDDTIKFYTKTKPAEKAKPAQKTEEEKEADKKRDLAWKTVDRFAQNAADLRERFAEGLTVSPKNAMRMMQYALAAAFSCMIGYTTPTMAIKEKMGATSHLIPEIIAEVTNHLMDMPQSKWPELILMMYEGDWKERKAKPPMFAKGSRGYELPKFKRNVMMELCYTWLTEFGYQMSTEEIEMMSGTHPVFQTEVVK